MKTLLDKALLRYAGTLEVEYLGKRCAKIKFKGNCKLRWLESELYRYGVFTCTSPNKFYSHVFNYKWINDFNSNGIWTTATIRLHPWSIPFYD